MKFVRLMLLLMSVAICAGCQGTNQLEEVSAKLTNYDIVATLDYENKTISAEEKVFYRNNTEQDLNELKFHLYPNAFRETADKTKCVNATQFSRAYPNGFSEGGIDINSVSIAEKRAEYAITGDENNILSITLEDAVRPSSVVCLDIKFGLKIPNCAHRFGYAQNTLNLGNWYPIACVFEAGEFVTDGYCANGDPFFSEVANYFVTLNYPSQLKLACTGEKLGESISKDISTTQIRALAVRDFACVFSEKFVLTCGQVGDTQINYFAYNDEKMEQHLQVCVDAVSTFNELFGLYPYAVLNVVKTNFFQGGMEYPQLVYISDMVDNESEYSNVIVHEIAHQWWYGVVGNNECENAWIDEGLAEYSTALFYDKNPSYGKTTREVLNSALSSYLLFVDVYKEVYDEFDSSMNRNITKFKTETEYVYLTYVKGVLMFDSISEIVGERKMEDSLKNFYKQNSFKNVKPVDLISTFEKTTHQKLGGYIMSWLDGSVVFEELTG